MIILYFFSQLILFFFFFFFRKQIKQEFCNTSIIKFVLEHLKQFYIKEIRVRSFFLLTLLLYFVCSEINYLLPNSVNENRVAKYCPFKRIGLDFFSDFQNFFSARAFMCHNFSSYYYYEQFYSLSFYLLQTEVIYDNLKTLTVQL